MFDRFEFQVCLAVASLSILVGFIPRLLESLAAYRQRSHLHQFKKNLRNINDYDDNPDDDFDEDLYILDIANKHKKSPQDNNTAQSPKPQVNFLMNAISLVVGFQSNITLIGLPVEFYRYGFKSLQLTLSLVLGPILIAAFFIPFIFRIQSASVYAYLDNKFNGSRSVKNLALILAIIFQLAFASIVLFSTANILIQIISVHYTAITLTPIVFVLGTVGLALALLGLKSVIWANFLQYLILIVCNATVIIMGLKFFDNNKTNSVAEGLSLISNMTYSTGHNRLFLFQENFNSRYTFWNGLIGLTFNTVPTYCLTQQSFMRIKQAKSMNSARLLVLCVIPFGILNIGLIVCLGAVIFGYFNACGDPLASGTMANQNQLLARFLTQFYGDYRGLIGVYVGLLVSSAVNSIASSLKGLAVTISGDILGGRRSEGGENTNKSRAGELTSSYNVRRLSEKYGLAYNTEEEILNFQIRFNTTRNKRKLLKEYARRHEPVSKRLEHVSVVLSGVLMIMVSLALDKSGDSLTGTAMSLLNCVHGPMIFIYLCARFNEIVAEKNQYISNRSSILNSKGSSAYIHSFDVVVSCLASVALLQIMYFGKMLTYSEYESFYTADYLKVGSNSLNATSSLQSFCQQTNSTDYSHNYLKNESPEHNNSRINYLNQYDTLKYVFGVSFNWYPFIGLLICCKMILILSVVRCSCRKLFSKCFVKKTY